mgnify:FL=1
MKIEPRTFTLPSGEVLTVRSLCADDAEALNAFRYAIYSETYFMARYPEEGANLETVQTGLAACGKSPVNFEVGAFAGEKLVGEFGVAQVRPHIKYRHRAVMGISVRKEYWGCGLGGYLMQLAIDQTRSNGFEQLELGVYSDNARAIHLYEKVGFESYGIQPRAFKLKDGTYRDEIIMVKML